MVSRPNIWQRIADDVLSIRNRLTLAESGAPARQAVFDSVPSVNRVSGSAIGAGGDSITAGSGSTAGSGLDWYNRLLTLLTGLMSPTRSVNAGITGHTSAMLLARIDPIVAACDIGLINIGANDAGLGVPLSEFQANLMAIKAKFDAAGKPVVFGEVPPRGNDADTTPAMVKRINAYNLWLRFWTALNGLPLVPVHRLLVDPLTGYMKTDYWTAPDETHPNNAGHGVIAQAVADVLRPLLPTPYWPVVTKGAGLMARPLMDTGAEWGVYAGPQFAEDPITVASVNNDLPAGQWTRLRLASGATTVGARINGWVAGDRLLLMAKVRASYSGALAKVQLMDQNQSARVIGVDQPVGVGPFSLVFDYRVPSANIPTELHWGIRITAPTGASYVDIGACDVFNLTQMGLDGMVI